MPHTHRAMIIPASDRDTARKIWGTLDPEYADTFRFACAADGSDEITHYCDAGPITTDAALLMPLAVYEQNDGTWKLIYRDDGNPRRVKWFCEQKGYDVTFKTVTDIWDRADVTEEPLNDALARRGLHIVWPEAPAADAEGQQIDPDNANPSF